MEHVLKHLYISPLEFCNLGCKICYTAKTRCRLSNESILDFVKRYAQATELQTITFCGGEVFLMPQFPALVNSLSDYFVQIITNGTVDVLEKLQHPNRINVIVSLDGLPDYHDLNRGTGMWQKSTAFMKKAQTLGFHLEVFSIATKENIPRIEEFENQLFSTFKTRLPITYHPRKPLAYLSQHPVSHRVGSTSKFTFPNSIDRAKLGKDKNIFPPLDLNCYQISVLSDGNVYGCCEGITVLGNMDDDMGTILQSCAARIKAGGNCVEPEFRCGLEMSCP